MENNKKKLLIDLAIVIIPVVIMLLLMPILPEKVPIHWDLHGANGYIDKKYSFILGILPFVIYKTKYAK